VTSGGGSAEPSPGAPALLRQGADAPSGGRTQGRLAPAAHQVDERLPLFAGEHPEALGHDGEQVSRLDPVTLGDAAHAKTVSEGSSAPLSR